MLSLVAGSMTGPPVAEVFDLTACWSRAVVAGARPSISASKAAAI